MYTVGTARYLFFKGRVRRALTPENGTAIPVSLRWRTLEEKSSNGFEFRRENGIAVNRPNRQQKPDTEISTFSLCLFRKRKILFHRVSLSCVIVNSIRCFVESLNSQY